jgi:hypothetical protein
MAWRAQNGTQAPGGVSARQIGRRGRKKTGRAWLRRARPVHHRSPGGGDTGGGVTFRGRNSKSRYRCRPGSATRRLCCRRRTRSLSRWTRTRSCRGSKPRVAVAREPEKRAGIRRLRAFRSSSDASLSDVRTVGVGSARKAHSGNSAPGSSGRGKRLAALSRTADHVRRATLAPRADCPLKLLIELRLLVIEVRSRGGRTN